MKHIAASFAVVGLVLFSSEPAEACSPACLVPKLVPAAGTTVPASAPGLLLLGPIADPSSAQLVDSLGNVVPGSFQKDTPSGVTYFAPSSPLTPGDYATRSLTACNSSDTVDAAFTVTASAAYPTATGTLTMKKFARENLSAWTNSGSCTEEVDAAYVDLDVAVDPALAPYLSIATWQTTIDGQWWSRKDPITYAVAPSGNARSYLRIFTPCDGKALDGRDPGIAPGTHSIEVRAFLPGGAALAPATISVELTCDGGAIVGDGEIPGSTGGGTSTDGSGGRATDPGSRTETSPSTSGTNRGSAQDGCSASPHVASSSASIGAAIFGLLALAGLRRRRNPLH